MTDITINANTFEGSKGNVEGGYAIGDTIYSGEIDADFDAIAVDIIHHTSKLQAIVAKLNGIEDSADVNLTTAEIVAAINASAETIDADNLDIESYVDGLIATAINGVGGHLAETDVTDNTKTHIPDRIQDTGLGYSATPIALQTTPTTLTDEINNIRRMIKLIVGKTNWTDTPGMTINAIDALIDNDQFEPKSHASTHITGGSDAIAGAQAGGSSGLMSGSDKLKLDGIEALATADQTAAEIRTLVASAEDCNVLTNLLKAKLDGIENNATKDQDGEEIKLLYEAEPNTNAYTDSEKTKLSGIAIGATNTQQFNVVEKTTNYTATLTDYVILCNATSAAITITLPAVASSTKQIYQIKKVDSSANAVTIDANGTELIDNNQTFDLVVQNEALTLYCTGTKWVIL